MPSFADRRMRELNEKNRAAQEHVDKGDFVTALKVFQDVREGARKLGLDSSWAAWGIAVCNEGMGDLEMAFQSMCESLQVDPLNVGKQASFDSIVGRIRAALAAEERAASDPSTPRLYALLARAGEADVGAHLAMARHLSAVGDVAGATRLVDAVTTLFPGSRDAWQARAALARDAGDEVVAGRCEVEATGCAGVSTPFGVPRPGAAC